MLKLKEKLISKFYFQTNSISVYQNEFAFENKCSIIFTYILNFVLFFSLGHETQSLNVLVPF
jgi:hypothetical protein